MNALKWITAMLVVGLLLAELAQIWRYGATIVRCRREGKAVGTDIMLGLIGLSFGFVVSLIIFIATILSELGI